MTDFGGWTFDAPAWAKERAELLQMLWDAEHIIRCAIKDWEIVAEDGELSRWGALALDAARKWIADRNG